MDFFVNIKGINEADYKRISEDLIEQFSLRGDGIPIFVFLPNCDYPEIEVIWFDKQLEQDVRKELVRKAVE